MPHEFPFPQLFHYMSRRSLYKHSTANINTEIPPQFSPPNINTKYTITSQFIPSAAY
jgi:hypothetical protein